MPLPLPETLQALVNTALAEMQADPDHRLSHQRRGQIYDALGPLTEDISRNARGWLAVITARRVLPAFQAAFPEDTLPQQLLDMAVSILQGRGDEAAAEELQEWGYNASGNAWGYDEAEVPWNADLAGSAAYHALKEARGQPPLQYLDKVFKLGAVAWPPGEQITEYPEPRPATQFTDEDLCQIDASDTAANAAVAFACEAGGPFCDPGKLREFWTWWLTEAIPEAWETAQIYEEREN
jgi:hypothetical protein